MYCMIIGLYYDKIFLHKKDNIIQRNFIKNVYGIFYYFVYPRNIIINNPLKQELKSKFWHSTM